MVVRGFTCDDVVANNKLNSIPNDDGIINAPITDSSIAKGPTENEKFQFI